MERLALKDVENWREGRRKPLMVYGAREVSKTYLVKDLFAERHYPGELHLHRFQKGFADAQAHQWRRLRRQEDRRISFFEGREIDGSTLLIFDEVQEALLITMAMKCFKQDLPEIPVIRTGSMSCRSIC